MAEEMIESLPWESEEAEYSEADEAMAEAEESEEDVPWRRRRKKAYQPARGVQGIALRGQDGRIRNLQFPAKLATVAETNRNLASQEIARRAVEDRLDRLEIKFRGQLKKETSTTGLVTILIGGGLAGVGAFQAANQGSGSLLANWASRDATKMSAVVSVTQLATSGAKLAFNGRYVRSGFGISADIYSALQLALFAFGSLRVQSTFQQVDDIEDPKVDPSNFAIGTRVLDTKTHKPFIVIQTTTGNAFEVAA